MDLIFFTAIVILLGIIITTGMETRVSEVQDAVDAVVNQLVKVRAEVVKTREDLLDTIAGLEAEIAAGVKPDLTALKDIAQALDDLTPDVEESPSDEPSEG